MAALNLFPARVAFVNPDGTLTNEAYRALQIVFDRVGGALGDSGADVFGQVFGRTGEADSTLQNDVVQSFNAPDVVYADTVQSLTADIVYSDNVQPANFNTDYYSDVAQYPTIDMQLPDVVQPSSKDREAGIFTTLDVSGDASIGGKLKLSAGTAALPGLYWSTDTTTGFYRIGANNIGFSVSGVKVLDILSTGLTVTGAVTTTGALSSSLAGGYGINLSGASASFRGVRVSNTGATTVFAIDGAVGGSFISGSPAYSTALVTFDANPILIGITNVEKARFTTAGVAFTGTMSVTGAAGINGKTAVSSAVAPAAAGATYTAVEQALLNDIRTRLVNFGIYA